MELSRNNRGLIQQCELGDVGAQRLLAGMYLLGQGVPKNDALAYYWLIRAHAPDGELEAVARLLSADEIGAVETLVTMVASGQEPACNPEQQ